MSMRKLSSQFKTKLESISDIQEVYNYPWIDFEGYPAATITPSAVDSDYETHTENLRTYVFTIRIFISLERINAATYKDKVDEGYRIAEELVDTVIDKFDKDETLSSISLPTGKTMINLVPAPSSIVYFEQEKIIVAEVKLNTNISFDTTS